MTRGLIIGKFMPPHQGHQYLIDYARSRVDELTVIVFTKSYEPIPGHLRFDWMRTLNPEIQVLNIHDDYPTDFNNPELWKLRMAMIHEAYPHQPDYIFSSEPYGSELARRLGAQAIVVDETRAQVPISATMIREQPLAQWDFIPACVRPYFVRRVVVLSPDTNLELAEALAQHYKTVVVPDYVHERLDTAENGGTVEDGEAVVGQQIKGEDEIAEESHGIVICASSLLITALWCQHHLDECPRDIMQMAAERKYDLYLVSAPDDSSVDDSLLEPEQPRLEMQKRVIEELNNRNIPYVQTRGAFEARLSVAIDAIDSHLNADRNDQSYNL